MTAFGDIWAPPKPAAPPIDKQASDTIAAKTASAGTAAPVTSQAATTIADIHQQDAVKASADVLKLSGDVLAKATSDSMSAAGSKLGAGGHLLASADQIVKGDTYAAASAAQTGLQKLSPALSASPVGAVANAILLGSGNQKLGDQAKTLKTTAAKALSSKASPTQRVKAAFDFTVAGQQLANIGRAMGNAVVGLGTFAAAQASSIARLAPLAGKLEKGAAKVAVSPLGRSLRFLNKWIPLLNVAGVALSGKAAVDVFRGEKSSKTTKVLSIASLLTAAGGLAAGLTLGGLPFVGVIGASVAADLALAAARKRDLTQGDMDQQVATWKAHPAAAAVGATRWLGHAVQAGGNAVIGTIHNMGDRLAGRHTAQSRDPRPSKAANPG
ncbi:MAG: hypothetical protein JWM80_1652 [Cyanobacteria bacterium RYN_339]|nr:hypothetical protein [Cyanobacteria bacterium RYN_339]